MRSSLYLPEKGVFESTLKTISSKRVIHIDSDLAMLLQYHKRWQEEKAAELGSQWQSDNNRLRQADQSGDCYQVVL